MQLNRAAPDFIADQGRILSGATLVSPLMDAQRFMVSPLADSEDTVVHPSQSQSLLAELTNATVIAASEKMALSVEDKPTTQEKRPRRLKHRLINLVKPRANHNAPGYKASGECWEGGAAHEIISDFASALERRSARNFKDVPMARVLAINEHRRNGLRRPDSWPSDKKYIFDEIKTKAQAESAMVAALFEAVNQPDKDEVLQSFKRARSGYLHKYDAIAMQNVNGVLGVGAMLAGSLPGVGEMFTAARIGGQVAQFGFDHRSGDNRPYFRGAEELAPTAVPRPTSSAGNAKNIIAASWGTRKLVDAEGVLKEFKRLLALDVPADPDLRKKLSADLAAQREKAEVILLAERDFKISSGNVAVEWAGSKRQLGAHYVDIGINVAGVVGVAVGAGLISVPATRLLSNAIHLTYHFSGGAELDVKAKLLKLLVVSLKSDDLIDTKKCTPREIASLYLEHHDQELLLAEKLAGKFNIDNINRLLASPVDIRMENGKELLKGRLASVLDQVQRLKEICTRLPSDQKKKDLLENKTGKLKQLLLDIACVDTALHDLKDAFAKASDGQVPKNVLRTAGERFDKVQDEDFRKLFTGSLEEQMAILESAKRERALEFARFRTANSGGAALTSLVSFGIGLEGALHTASIERIASPASSALTAKNSAEISGNRNGMRGRFEEMNKLREDRNLVDKATSSVALALTNVDTDAGEDQLTALIDHGVVPAEIRIATPGDDGSTTINLTAYEGYYRRHDRNKPIFGDNGRAQLWKEHVKNLGAQIGTSFFGLGAKAIAVQKNMKHTREARRELRDVVLEAQRRLKELDDAGKMVSEPV